MNMIKKTMAALCLGAVVMAAPSYAHAQAVSGEPTFEDLQNTNGQTQQYNEQRSGADQQYTDQRNVNSGVYDATRAVEDATRQRELDRAQDKYKNKFDNTMLLQDTVDILGRATQQVIQNETYNQMRAQEDPLYGQAFHEEHNARLRASDEYDLNMYNLISQAREARQREYDAARQEQEMDRQEFESQQSSEGQGFAGAQDAQTQAAEGAISARTSGGTWGASAGNTTVQTIGASIYNFGTNIANAPSLFYIMAYVTGVYFMALGLLKANKAAMEPGRDPLSNAVKFMAAGALLSALPMTAQILENSFGFDGTSTFDLIYTKGLDGASGSKQGGAQGLDQFMVNLMKDITRPMMSIINLICFAGGVFLLFIGLQRLVKGSDQGPRGPAGLGTLMTFVVGSALISFAPTLDIVLNTVFGTDTQIATYPGMSAIAGKIGTDEANLAQAQAVITALLAFLTIVGLISFARGLFMLKDAADGSQNASLMGSMSHLIAGVCCVNFGAFANMLQKTLNLTNFGIAFGN